MPLTSAEIQPEVRLDGVIVEGIVTVVAFKPHGEESGTLTYRTAEGGLGERLLYLRDLAQISVASKRRWTFDADGADFRLASEARRMKWAHLSDPFAAIDTSNIEPYPHQIDAVYNILLNQHPIRYVLADDPGAGKTIMSGLLIRELMIRQWIQRREPTTSLKSRVTCLKPRRSQLVPRRCKRPSPIPRDGDWLWYRFPMKQVLNPK